MSPFELRNGVDEDRGLPVIVHPGWGKDPKRHARLLVKLADAGFFPIGIDTRYAYSDRSEPWQVPCIQPLIASKDNPYFRVSSRIDNRFTYRRPTAVLDMCVRLGIDKRAYVGHSDGGRIVSLAAKASPEQVAGLVLVNAAGTGDSSNGLRRLLVSNTGEAQGIFRGDNDEILRSALSACSSVAYGALHLRRTLGEKRMIQGTNLWDTIDVLGEEGVPTSILHARNDALISYKDSYDAALQRPWLNFVSTEGGHGNVYHASVQEMIIKALSHQNR